MCTATVYLQYLSTKFKIVKTVFKQNLEAMFLSSTPCQLWRSQVDGKTQTKRVKGGGGGRYHIMQNMTNIVNST